jgi:hypothetical protein
MSHSLDGTIIGIVIFVVVVVVALAVWLLLVRRAADHPAQEHPKRDPLRGLVQGGQHVGGGRSVMPTRDAPVPEGGGEPPSVEEEDAGSQAARAEAHAAHERRRRGTSPMDL